MVESRLRQARGGIGHQGESQHLQPGLSGGDGLERGRHPDQVSPQQSCHPHLSGGFVLGAAELHVDALGQFRGNGAG